ncbi:MAG: M48 family metalloprotease [Bacteroidota bacterium]
MFARPLSRVLSGLALLALVGLLPACTPEDDDLIRPSEFTKTQREALGDLVEGAIQSNTREFSLLPNLAPYDEAYDYLHQLYSQAYDDLRRDRYSPTDDRWDPERPWNLHVLLDEQKNAFVLPGGHLYLTTGLLKSIGAENELYYIMACELTLMNEKYLFNRLLNQFNTTILVDLVNGSPSPNGATPNSIAHALSTLDFEEEDLLVTDEQTIELICQTSIWDPAGLVPLYAANVERDMLWIERRDYNGRASRVGQLAQRDGGCGIRLSNGAYAQKVLANLP